MDDFVWYMGDVNCRFVVGGGKDREEMSDLIRRSEVINLIESKFVDGCLMQGEKTLIDGYGLIDEVSELPTAFDTEKVVEQLKGLSNAEADYYYARSNDVIDREDAIDIVEKGGVE